jgi:2-phospho-L-lactate guanylyltransferase
MTKPGFWAVVPAKDLAQAKRRLADLLTLEERQGLACAMLRDVLAALAAASGLAGTLVVTRDAELAGIAQEFGARIMADLRHEGPSAAVTLAATKLAGEGAQGMLAIPADLPLASAAEIGEILAAAGAAPSVTLVPALADMGSNAVALAPADAIPLCFGTRSFFLHQEAALGCSIEPRILRLPGLGLDIDRPDDLLAFMARKSKTRSYAYLDQRDVTARLTALDINRKRGAQ